MPDAGLPAKPALVEASPDHSRLARLPPRPRREDCWEDAGVPERSLLTLLEGGSFFESPRWHEGRWWVSDFYRHLVLTVDPAGATEEQLTVEGQPSGLGWMPDGSLLVVSMRDHRILRWTAETGATLHADVS